MASFPKECVPLRGSQGEIDRLNRLRKQLPPHDWSHEACHKMSDLEAKRLGKLIEKRMRMAYGVGCVEVDQEDGRVCETRTHCRLPPLDPCVPTCLFPCDRVCVNEITKLTVMESQQLYPPPRPSSPQCKDCFHWEDRAIYTIAA